MNDYVSFGIDAIMENEIDILSYSPSDSLLTKITKMDIDPMTAKEIQDFKKGIGNKRDKIITEGLLDAFKKEDPYKICMVENCKIENRPAEMYYNTTEEEAVAKLQGQMNKIKFTYDLMSDKFFTALYQIQDQYHMNVKDPKTLRKMVKMDLFFYIPKVPKNKEYSFIEFAWNYDNKKGNINFKFFEGCSAKLYLWFKDKTFYSYKFVLDRTYRTDEFNY